MMNDIEMQPALRAPGYTEAEYLIVVTFDLHPGTYEAFMPHMLRNAETSRLTEAGCRRFDVLVPDGSRERVVLYELYASRADFADHCRRPHFLDFDMTTRPMVRAKSFTEYRIVGQTEPQP